MFREIPEYSRFSKFVATLIRHNAMINSIKILYSKAQYPLAIHMSHTYSPYLCLPVLMPGTGRDRDETRDAKVRDRDETKTLGILSETRPRRSSTRDLGRDVW